MTTASTAPGLALPVAAIEQSDVDPFDWSMTAQARLRRPAVRWWWGERMLDGTNGARCYLCDRFVATWQRSYPTPASAIELVLLHRSMHRALGLGSLGTDTAGTLPAAAAPPPEGQE